MIIYYKVRITKDQLNRAKHRATLCMESKKLLLRVRKINQTKKGCCFCTFLLCFCDNKGDPLIHDGCERLFCEWPPMFHRRAANDFLIYWFIVGSIKLWINVHHGVVKRKWWLCLFLQTKNTFITLLEAKVAEWWYWYQTQLEDSIVEDKMMPSNVLFCLFKSQKYYIFCHKDQEK